MPPLGSELLAPFEVGLRQLQGRLPALESRHVGAEVGDLGVHVLDGVFELEPIGPGLGHQAAHLGLGGHQVRFGRRHGGLLDRDLNLVGFLVELDQQVPLLHAVVVVHQDPAHLAGDPGSHEGHVAVDVSVVGGNRVQHRFHDGNKPVAPDRQPDHGHRPQQPFSPGVRWRPGPDESGGVPAGGLVAGAACWSG